LVVKNSSEKDRKREEKEYLGRMESSAALEWTLRAAIISLLRRMFSSRLRSYSVSFWDAIEEKWRKRGN